MKRRPVLEDDGRVAAVAAALGLERPQVTLLPGGGANRTLRLRDAHADFVLRMAGRPAGALLASLEAECVMLRLAAAAGLAPEIVLARPSEGLVAMRFVEGRMPSRRDLQDPAFLVRIGEWLSQLHKIAPPESLPPVDFGARAAGYLQDLQARGQLGQAAQLARRLAERRAALEPVERLACCHHDLHRHNVIDTGPSLVVLDWEYAGPGDPAADIAACIAYHDIGPDGRNALFTGHGDDTPALRARVAALGWIFDCLWYGWNAVAACEGVAVDAGLQARLLARLVR